MLTRTEIDKRLAGRDRPITPQHAEAEAELDTLNGKPRKPEYPPVSEDKPRDLEHVEDREDPDVEKGGKWKKLVLDAVRAVAQPVSGQECEDGTSDRPVHDPVVPYEDMPEDDLASMPMASTAPVDPVTSKAHDFLGTMRPVTGPQDVGPGGLFTGKRLPPDAAPEKIPGPVSPEQFRRGPVREGHAASSQACGQPNRGPMPATPGGAGKLGRADTGQVLTTRLPGER